ncbi:YecA family protein [Sinimarinibacterium thermocellulolyticum]|uniref:SEC-C domain-containing protein n=1 Tax=Sinimarinibacterium thermocellulolyticum TaxID=3170016 RepID=A0ABV2A8R5_9GAMM
MNPGRNDPCPCGSGKKYKHCCLAAARSAADGDAAELVWRRLRRLKDEAAFATTMLRFVKDVYGPGAIGQAWDEFTLWDEKPFDPASPHMTVFMPWLFFQWAPDPEQNAVADTSLHQVPPARAFLERKARTLDPLLREYVQSCLDSPLSFFEVLDAVPEQRLRLRNVFTDEEHDVRERSASQFFQTGDLLFGQVAVAQGVTLLEACGPVVIPPLHKIGVIALRQKMEQGSRATPRERLREYDVELRERYLDLTDQLLHPRVPELRNTDGEKLVPQRLVFDIESARQTYDELKRLDFEADDTTAPEDAIYDADGRLQGATIIWKKPGNRQNKGWSNTILGTLRIEGRRMIAEVNSHERADALRRIVEDKLGPRARYRVAEVQSVERLFEDARSGEVPQRGAESQALRESPQVQALLAEHMARHYEDWVEQEIPALGGRKPLQAMQQADGPEKVEALVQSMERKAREMDPPVDGAIFRRLRERLGLPITP